MEILFKYGVMWQNVSDMDLLVAKCLHVVIEKKKVIMGLFGDLKKWTNKKQKRLQKKSVKG